MAVQLDVADGAAVRAAVEAAASTFGRLDFAHNNSRTFAVAPLADLAEADWHRVLTVNLTGVYLGMKYQIPAPARTGRAIVNTASIWSGGWQSAAQAA